MTITPRMKNFQVLFEIVSTKRFIWKVLVYFRHNEGIIDHFDEYFA